MAKVIVTGSSGFNSLHYQIEKQLGKPQKCEHCGTTEGRMEWANKSHEYKQDLSDWLRLCRKCHRKHDK